MLIVVKIPELINQYLQKQQTRTIWKQFLFYLNYFLALQYSNKYMFNLSIFVFHRQVALIESLILNVVFILMKFISKIIRKLQALLKLVLSYIPV